jgi:putative transposase
MTTALDLANRIPLSRVCDALGLARATFYRARRPGVPPKPRSRPPRSLTDLERRTVLDVLNSERFVDHAPRAVHAVLLDENRYLCSPSTMYRVLRDHGATRERRDQLVHPSYAKPELIAERPNEVWSWDITKIRGPAKWCYFQLYVVLDIFSRYVVAWMLAQHESARLAQQLLRTAIEREAIVPGTLTIHADRGAAMRSKSVAQLLDDLDVERSHSRPHVSDDNPFSEAQFKTLKYDPEFPNRFTSPEQARMFLLEFFDWYNREHRHSALGYLTPQDVHRGRAPAVVAQRQLVLDAAFARHPERFVRRRPVAASPPAVVAINPPKVPPVLAVAEVH